MDIQNLLPQKVKSLKARSDSYEQPGPFKLVQVPDPPYGELVFIREEDGFCVPWHAVDSYTIETKGGDTDGKSLGRKMAG